MPGRLYDRPVPCISAMSISATMRSRLLTRWLEEYQKQEQHHHLLGEHQMNKRACCSNCNFKGADQQKKVDQLSVGGTSRASGQMLKSDAVFAPPRRTKQRPQHGYAARAGRGAGGVPRRRRRRQPGVALVSRPRPDSHFPGFQRTTAMSEWIQGARQGCEHDKMRRGLGTGTAISAPDRIQGVQPLIVYRCLYL